MKRINFFWIFTAFALLFGFGAILHLLNGTAISESLILPAGFPTNTGLLVIWGFLFALWGLGTFFVYSVNLSPRRKRNIFLNTIILIGGVYLWNYMIFGAVNLPGALAICIACVLLTLVVWFMYLVTHRYGGYLFTPMMIWTLYLLYLSISFTIKN